jgi:hypothetical protein
LTSGRAIKNKMDMKVVYVEAVLMPNREVIHFGKTLGFVTDKQAQLVDSGACKMTTGNEPVVSVSKERESA